MVVHRLSKRVEIRGYSDLRKMNLQLEGEVSSSSDLWHFSSLSVPVIVYISDSHTQYRLLKKYSETDAVLYIAECRNKYRKQKLYVHFIALHSKFRAGPPGSCSNLQYLQHFPAELANIPE